MCCASSRKFGAPWHPRCAQAHDTRAPGEERRAALRYGSPRPPAASPATLPAQPVAPSALTCVPVKAERRGVDACEALAAQRVVRRVPSCRGLKDAWPSAGRAVVKVVARARIEPHLAFLVVLRCCQGRSKHAHKQRTRSTAVELALSSHATQASGCQNGSATPAGGARQSSGHKVLEIRNVTPQKSDRRLLAHSRPRVHGPTMFCISSYLTSGAAAVHACPPREASACPAHRPIQQAFTR